MNSIKITTESRRKALALYLEIDESEINEGNNETNFEIGREEYMVLTDTEADEKAADYIKESLWAFNASFLSSYTDLPEEMFSGMQDKCESANPAFLKCVERAGGLAGFVEQAISADGREHFMSSYDGEENEQGQFFIYRVN